MWRRTPALLLPLVALSLVACAETVVLEGDDVTSLDVVFTGPDFSSGRDLGDHNGTVPELPFVPADLLCPETCDPRTPCIETQNGYQCAIPCAQGICPDGFACQPFGAEFVCVYHASRLCLPCREDYECAVPGLPLLEAECVPWADVQGSFCSFQCGETYPCPSGYSCQKVEKGSICLPAAAQCSCAPLGAMLSLTTTCSRETSYGLCYGEVRCDGASLTTCDAPTPKEEACNGQDDDCDGAIDEGFADSDYDGIADCIDPVIPDPDPNQNDLDQDGVPNDLDCSPGNPSIYPGATEGCNGIDDDCDGTIDEGYPDKTGDGKPDCSEVDSDNDGTLDSQDCGPSDPTIYPGAAEICNSKDDNCDGNVDPPGTTGCKTHYADNDGDGYGNAQDSLCLCKPKAPHTTISSADCNDSNKNIYPGAQELCNGIDDDCSGSPEGPGTSGCTNWYKDSDQDGFGTGAPSCLCAPSSPYTASKSGDCNDSSASVNPNAAEVCNSQDDNCDGLTDPTGTCQTGHVICLDPGDGGTVNGTVGVVVEKTLNLDQALKARQQLQADQANATKGGSWTVIMTRESDVTVTLEARTAYANSNAAERFVSIHNNSFTDATATGTETYKAIAASANAGTLAATLQAKLVAALLLKDRGIKTADWYVLTATTMPAVVAYAGFVTNPNDMAVCNTPAGLLKFANALLNALQLHFGYTEYTP